MNCYKIYKDCDFLDCRDFLKAFSFSFFFLLISLTAIFLSEHALSMVYILLTCNLPTESYFPPFPSHQLMNSLHLQISILF